MVVSFLTPEITKLSREPVKTETARWDEQWARTAGWGKGCSLWNMRSLQQRFCMGNTEDTP